MSYKIAIDGIAGSGKSTICKLISKDYDFTFISTGGFYRIYGYILNLHNLIDGDQEIIINELKKYNVEVIGDKFFINKKDMTSKLRTEDVSLLASKIATKDFIRSFITKQIIELTNSYPKVLMDGRGIAEEIMPDANLKFYFYSSLKTRVNRRIKELKTLNKKTNYFSVYWDMFKRDWKDKHRKLAPSKSTKDTIKINTSNKTIEQVYQEVKKYIKV